MTPSGESTAPDGAGSRADAVLARLGLTTPRRRDAALAAGTALVSVGVVLVALTDPALSAGLASGPVTVPVVLALLVAQAGVLVARRDSPALCLAVALGLQVVLAAAVPPEAFLRGPAPVIAAYTCGAWLPARRALVLGAAAAVVETAGFVAFAGATPVAPVLAQAASSALTYLAATMLGAYVATRRRYTEMARLRAAEAVEVHRARADAAVGAERTRVARELHDIAAHHLAAMVVQASVAERLIDRDPDGARRTIVEVRTQGRATLRDLRQVVGALRERGPDGDHDDGEPVPGLAVLHRLASSAAVDLEVVGEPRELSPVADVSAYRVAQEALSNARDHAPGARVSVRVEHGETATVLEVRNGPAAGAPAADREPGRGLGLVGMRERAELIGADLDAGPLPDGGWRVRLALPRSAS